MSNFSNINPSKVSLKHIESMRWIGSKTPLVDMERKVVQSQQKRGRERKLF